jgi:hypothetical protein
LRRKTKRKKNEVKIPMKSWLAGREGKRKEKKCASTAQQPRDA